MVDHFHHGREVALLLEFARIDPDEIEKLIRIDEVEIAGQGKVAGGDGISFDKGVAKFGEVLSPRAIAEVTKQQLADKGDMAFHQAGMLGDIGLVLLQLFDFLHDLREDVCDRLMVAAPDAMQEWVARFDIEFDGGYTGSVLAAVVLFFHQQVQLVKAVEDGTVLLKVVRERFS
jgi:hypothetical protein